MRGDTAIDPSPLFLFLFNSRLFPSVKSVFLTKKRISMIKKLLLSILCLSLFSGDVDALTKRQKRVIQVIGGGALALVVGTYLTFASRLAGIKCSKAYEKIVFCHCQKGDQSDSICSLTGICNQCDFDKSGLYANPPKAHKKGTGFKLWRNSIDGNTFFVKTPSKSSYEPIAVYSYVNGTDESSKKYDEKTFYDWASKEPKNKISAKIIWSAFSSPCEVFYHAKKDTMNFLKKIPSLCSKKPKAGEEY